MAETLGVRFNREYYLNPDIRYIVDSLCNEYALEHFGDMRLFEFLAKSGKLSAREAGEKLLKEIDNFNGDSGVNDDISLVILKRLR